jgi:hypothetical protein
MGLASASPQPAGERQRLSGVAGGLVDPPGREVGRPRAQRNDRRPGVHLATAELLNGAHDQRERLVSTAGEGCVGPCIPASPACVASPTLPLPSFGIQDCSSNMLVTLFNETH